MKLAIRSLGRGGAASAIAVLIVAILAALSGASEARALTVEAVSTSPADGERLATSPATITVTFNQTIGSAATVVIACNGNPGPGTSPAVSSDLLSLKVDLGQTPLPKGSCEVRWSVQATAEQGVQSGSFSFTIEQDPAAAGATSTGPAAPGGTAAAGKGPSSATSAQKESAGLGAPLGLARLVSMLSVAILFGSLVLIAVAWPEGVEYVLTIRFLRLTWIAAVAGTAVMVVGLTAQVTGRGFGGALNPTTWLRLRDSTPGIAALVRMAFVVAIGWVAIRPDRSIDPGTQLPALAIPAVAVATMGFSRTGGDLELIGYAAAVGHALAVAVWFGGLMLLARVVLAGPGEDDLVHAVRGFSRLATPAMLITVVTGAVQLYRLDSGQLTGTTHGRLMLVKLIPVIAMVVIGSATRQFVRARLARVESMASPLVSRLRRAVGFEAALGALILAVTSWMLSTQPGNLVAGARSSGDFAAQMTFVDAAATLEAKLSLDPARVGANELLLEITQPATGITQILIQFTPPASATEANPVSMTITEVSGAGAAHLERSIGLPLNAAGAWTVSMEVTTAAGVFKQNALLNVRADGTTSDLPIPTIVETPVTAAATSSTVASG